MTRDSMPAARMPGSPVGKALEEMSASFERFCLAAGLEVLAEMMDADAEALCGPRHGRQDSRRAHRWGARVGRSVSTAARSHSSARAFASLAAEKSRCRAGSVRHPRIGSAAGR